MSLQRTVNYRAILNATKLINSSIVGELLYLLLRTATAMDDVTAGNLLARCNLTVNNIVHRHYSFSKAVSGIIMAALWNRARHYIFALWFLLSSSSFYHFPHHISAAADWMSTVLPQMAWP